MCSTAGAAAAVSLHAESVLMYECYRQVNVSVPVLEEFMKKYKC